MSPASFPVRRVDRVEQGGVRAVGTEDREGDDHGHGASLNGMRKIELDGDAA